MSNLLKSKLLLGVVAFAIMFVGVVAVSDTASAQTTCSTGTTTLRVGSRGDAVKCLQLGLDQGIAADGIFGPKTKARVVAWQSSLNLVADGIFGPKSRAAFVGGGATPATPSAVDLCPNGMTLASNCTLAPNAQAVTLCPNGMTLASNCSVSPTGGAVNVSGVAAVALASDNPASGTVPDVANANFTKFTISSGATPTTITNLYVTRYGLSINSDVENIKILDENMVQVSSSGSLNSNNKAQITFSPALTIPAGTVKTFYIRAGIVNGTTAGKSVALGIDSASDVVANVTVGGSFPVKGNLMSTVLLDIGTLTADEDGTVTDSQPDGGDVDVVVNKFKLTAGSTEAVTVKQIAVERQGTASSSDIANIELFDVSKATSLGTAASWDANGLATFNNLNIVLDKGETRRFEVRVDIIGGSSLTINADLTDGSDVRVQATGNTYGFYITPTNSLSNGQGASNQTIQSGTLTVTKSASTPAAGNISAASDVNLAVFDFQVLGEPMKITSLEVNMDLTSMVYTEVTNVKLTDSATGVLLAGPKDLASDSSVVFTDVIILPVGVTKVKVTANIATSTQALDAVNVDIDDASTEIVAKGMTSNDSVVPSPTSAVSGNNLVIQGAALAAVTNTTPAARSIVVGQQDFVFATVTLSAANSGEDINVSTVVVENTVTVAEGTDSGADDVDNAEIWADLTSGTSARGDVYETLISTTKQFSGTSAEDDLLTFNLNPIITVPKNGSIAIAVVADLSADAEVDDTFTVSLDTDSGDVTANGKDTGSSVSVTPTGTGQTMTVATGGTLTTSVDSSSPSAALLLDNTSAEQTVAVFRLAANNTENLNVDSIKMTEEGTNGADVAAAYKFYNGSTLLGTVVPDGSGDAELFLTSGQLVIPASSYKLVTVKVVLNDIDGSGFVNGDTLIATINAAGDIDTTGLASGTAVDSTGTNYNAATHTLYEAYPTFAFNNTGVSTVLGASSNYLAGKLVITNNGNKDITFDSDDSLQINFEISGTLSSATNAVSLNDSEGTLLGQVNMGATTGSTSADIDFADSTLTVSAGSSETVTIYVNTAGLTADGNTLQAWLSDDAVGNLIFSIDGGTADYSEADFIFKGDIYGPSHVNPS